MMVRESKEAIVKLAGQDILDKLEEQIPDFFDIENIVSEHTTRREQRYLNGGHYELKVILSTNDKEYPPEKRFEIRDCLIEIIRNGEKD